ncbi:hypothetical protein [Pseudogulbenkiania subflava]|uniref:hypothetical protein n=1 Tax=Pseudogulbenkiania subflava TaxID=451637 RepID=UPI00117AC213|nr:hypothetical protein [Pseudogulbenkiania subflava]
MKTADELTYILKKDAELTRTAIALINEAGLAGLNIPHDVLLTTEEDPSIEKKAKCWREREDGDLLVVEVEPGVPSSRFYSLFLIHFADKKKKFACR